MTDRAEDEVEEPRALALIAAGSDFGGAVMGGMAGLIGGPIGVVAGAAAGTAAARAMRKAGAEFHGRLLAPRQQARAGGALKIAFEEYSRRREAGDAERTDTFFEKGGEEITEGVLLQAMNAYEERKVPILGRLLASFAFEPAPFLADAHLLVRAVDRLSYRQLVLLSILGDEAYRDGLDGRAVEVEGGGLGLPWPLLDELRDLGAIGIAGYRQDDGSVVTPEGTWHGDGHRTGVTWLERGVPTQVGQSLFRAGDLKRIPQEDKEAVWHEVLGEPPVA